jgi:hypothetical protein
MVVADTQGGNNHATIRVGEGAIAPNYCPRGLLDSW